MEISGKIKLLHDEQSFGASGFRKRELVIVTNEQYPQSLLIEFVQDKCDLLNNFKIDDEVVISINLRGREWINPSGEAKYFNSFQAWKMSIKGSVETAPPPPLKSAEDEDTNMPF